MPAMSEDDDAPATVVIPATLVALIRRLQNVKYGQRCMIIFTAGKVPDWTILGEGKIEQPAEGAETKHYEGHIKLTRKHRS